jgi:CO dehydrogenase nickel-insertion accessory protein CooC1
MLHPLAGKKLGLFGKGGSGKSTTAVFLAKALRGLGYEVVLLDADSTNAGIAAALGLDWPPDPLIEYFGGTLFGGGSVTCPVDDPTPLTGAAVRLSRFPGRYLRRSREGIHLLVAGKLLSCGAGDGCDDGPISKIARDLTVLHAEGEEPITLIDFKAGAEDSARGVITGLDWVLVTVNPTASSVEFAADLKGMVEKMRAGAPPATRHPERPALARRMVASTHVRAVLPVLADIPDLETERWLRDRLDAANMRPIGVIRSDPAITGAWLRGEPLDSSGAVAYARSIVDRLNRAELRWSGRSLPAD